MVNFELHNKTLYEISIELRLSMLQKSFESSFVLYIYKRTIKRLGVIESYKSYSG